MHYEISSTLFQGGLATSIYFLPQQLKLSHGILFYIPNLAKREAFVIFKPPEKNENEVKNVSGARHSQTIEETKLLKREFRWIALLLLSKTALVDKLSPKNLFGTYSLCFSILSLLTKTKPVKFSLGVLFWQTLFTYTSVIREVVHLSILCEK